MTTYLHVSSFSLSRVCRVVTDVGNYARKKPILAKYNLILDTTAAR